MDLQFNNSKACFNINIQNEDKVILQSLGALKHFDFLRTTKTNE